jgi:hypothetical protein
MTVSALKCFLQGTSILASKVMDLSFAQCATSDARDIKFAR